ncbi:hypothetical protein OAG48_00310 [bacterium]|nr:hypothetical protein [bacterium]
MRYCLDQALRLVKRRGRQASAFLILHTAKSPVQLQWSRGVDFISVHGERMLNVIGWILLLLLIVPLGMTVLNGFVMFVVCSISAIAGLFSAEGEEGFVDRMKTSAGLAGAGLFGGGLMVTVPILVVYLILRFMIGATLVSQSP